MLVSIRILLLVGILLMGYGFAAGAPYHWIGFVLTMVAVIMIYLWDR